MRMVSRWGASLYRGVRPGAIMKVRERSRTFLSHAGQGEMIRKFAGAAGGVRSAVPVRHAATIWRTSFMERALSAEFDGLRV